VFHNADHTRIRGTSSPTGWSRLLFKGFKIQYPEHCNGGPNLNKEGKISSRAEEEFIPISALTIIPGTTGQFDLYLKRRDQFILYSQKGDTFSEEKLTKVLEVTDFFIPIEHKYHYERYMAKNLGELLMNGKVPLKERSKIFYNISSSVVKKTFDSKVPKSINPAMHKELLNIVQASIKYFTKEEALKSFSQFISHDYHTYSHSVQVMVLFLSIMQHLPGVDKKTMTEFGMGGLLHDIGKIVIPVEVLNKPGPLNSKEWDVVKTHPAKGLRMCSELPLAQTTVNCILFHHERMDGTGYPGGLGGEGIPGEARALAVCDVYDALTSDRPYAKAMKPYEALRYMKESMDGHFDQSMYKRLVFVLSNAKVV
jgi:HD-GYP domain-containing protein (c-di-GMP phosphodiesterase class II)